LIAKVKEKKMANNNLWLGILAMVLVFGMTAVGCDNDANNGDTTTYDPTGTWVITASGQNSIVTVTGNNWTITGITNDNGTFTRNGNICTLYSNALLATVGTATITSNTTMSMTLVSPSVIPGTYNAIKQQ
jgi:hypothetical protein